MKEVVAFLLAKLGGNENPQKDDIIKILDAVGIKADDAKMDAFFADLEKLDVSVDEAITAGTEKLAVVGTGGGGSGNGVSAEVTSKCTNVEEQKQEDAESDSEEQESSDGGPGLFDEPSSDESS